MAVSEGLLVVYAAEANHEREVQTYLSWPTASRNSRSFFHPRGYGPN